MLRNVRSYFHAWTWPGTRHRGRHVTGRSRRALPAARLAPDQDRIPRRRPGGGVRSRSHRVRRSTEREALALVLFGGFEYRQVGQLLAIPAAEAAALLRTAMLSRAG